MTYGSMTRSVNGNVTMVVKLDGLPFPTHTTITTTDALQVQWHFCRELDDFVPKRTRNCTNPDRTGQMLKVFDDRLCDNKRDCFGGEDESDIEQCFTQPGTGHKSWSSALCVLYPLFLYPDKGLTPSGCCSHVIFHYRNVPYECVYEKIFNEKPAFRCQGLRA